MVKSNAHVCKGEGACGLSTAHMRSLCTRGHMWLHDQPKVPRSGAYVVQPKELSRLLLDTLQALARFMSFMRGTSWTVG